MRGYYAGCDMKFKLGRKQITWGITIFCTFVACLFVVGIFFKANSISKAVNSIIDMLMSIIVGFIIAFVLTPILNFIESRIVKPVYIKMGGDYTYPKSIVKKKKIRTISILFTMIIYFAALYAFTMIVVPSLYASILQIVTNFPIYVNNVYKYTNDFLSDNPDIRRYVNQLTAQYSSMISNFFDDNVIRNLTVYLNRISQSFMYVVKGFLNFVVGTIVAVYILNSKEIFCAQGKKLAYAFFKENAANEIVGGCRFIYNTFTGFFVGKIVDSLIIGIICNIGCMIMHIPYAMLVSVVVGLTNIIPFFGPYIGAIFGGILLVMISPIAALEFLLFVVILQQFDGNILGPKILGNSTGLSSFWVIFAIMLFGGMWGIVGMIIGVPIFAVFYAFVRRVTNHMLRKKNIEGSSYDYVDVAYFERGEVRSLSDKSTDKFNTKKPESPMRKIFKIQDKNLNKKNEEKAKNSDSDDLDTKND